MGRLHALALALLPCGAALGGCLDERASLGRYAALAGASAPADAAVPAPDPRPPALPPAGAPSAPDAPDAAPPPEPPAAAPDAAPPPASACPSGYVLDVACTAVVPSQPGAPPRAGQSSTMMATLGFGLSQAAPDEPARIVDSMFTFLAWGLAFQGRLEGQLDCASGRFTATIADGLTGPPFVQPGPFVGELEGRVVDPSTFALSGTWWHGPPEGMGCTGVWVGTPR